MTVLAHRFPSQAALTGDSRELLRADGIFGDAFDDTLRPSEGTRVHARNGQGDLLARVNVGHHVAADDQGRTHLEVTDADAFELDQRFSGGDMYPRPRRLRRPDRRPER